MQTGIYPGHMEEALGWHGAEQCPHPSLPYTAGINHAWAAETAGNAPPLTPTPPSIPVMPGGWQGAKPDVTSWRSKKTLFKETLTSPGTQSAAGDLQPRVCGKSNDGLCQGRAGTHTSITSLLTVEESTELPRNLPSISPGRRR